MAYTRKWRPWRRWNAYSRRPVYKKKAGWRKGPKTRYARRRKTVNTQVHNFERYTPTAGLIASNTWEYSQRNIGGPGTAPTTITGSMWKHGFQFNLADGAQSVDFSDLFDQYRINYAVVEITPNFSSAQPNIGAATDGGNAPVLRYLRDYDDDDVSSMFYQPSEIDDRLAEMGDRVKTVPLMNGKTVKIKVVPALTAVGWNQEAQQPAVPNYTTRPMLPKFRQWVDCAYPQAVHYGLKVWIQFPRQLTVTTEPFATMRIRYNYSTRHVH